MSTRDIFQRRRLPVLNVVAHSEPTASQYVLQDPGLCAADDSSASSPEQLRNEAIKALRTVKDPEIPLNIYDLGLIYALELDDTRALRVAMTLTSPGCPVAGVLVGQVHDKLRHIPGVQNVRTELVWDPPWSKDRLDEAARLALDLY